MALLKFYPNSTETLVISRKEVEAANKCSAQSTQCWSNYRIWDSQAHCGTGLTPIYITESNVSLSIIVHQAIYHGHFYQVSPREVYWALVFINDLPSTITSLALLFADDTKCYQEIISLSDIQQLQNDLNLLFT